MFDENMLTALYAIPERCVNTVTCNNVTYTYACYHSVCKKTRQKQDTHSTRMIKSSTKEQAKPCLGSFSDNYYNSLVPVVIERYATFGVTLLRNICSFHSCLSMNFDGSVLLVV